VSRTLSTYLHGSHYLLHLANFQSQEVGSQTILQGHLQSLHQQPDGGKFGVIEDRTGAIPILISPLFNTSCQLAPSTIVSLAGRIEVDPRHQCPTGKEPRRILQVHLGQPASEAVFEQRNPVDLIPKRLSTDNESIQKLGSWIDLIFHPVLNHFVRSVFWDTNIINPFVQVAASWKHHHNYPGGLLQHSLEVTELMASMMQSTPMDDSLYEIGLVAALLHDLGKIHHLGRPFTRGLLDHQSLTLEKIAPHLPILDQGWPDGATALRHLLTGYESRYRSSMVLLTMLKSADAISAATEVEQSLYNRSKVNQQFVRAEGPGPASAFWRPNGSNQSITTAGEHG